MAKSGQNADPETMMDLPVEPIEHIFHPTDFSRGDAGAFAHALKIALTAKSKLHLLHVGQPDEEVHWEDFPHVRPWLEAWRVIPPGSSHDAVIETGLHLRKIRRKAEDPVPTILEFIEENSPDLAVLATHQRQGAVRWFHKSLAEPIARQAGVMTLFVPRRVQGFISTQNGEIHLRNVVVPVDRIPNPQVAIDGLVRLLLTLKIEQTHISLVHVGAEADFPSVTIPKHAAWTSEQDSWQGDVVDHILRISEDRDADLIVMATHGHDGFLDAIRGSNTERVLRGARCPLLAVPDLS